MGIPLRVLVVESSDREVELLSKDLTQGGYDPICERVETRRAMRAALATGVFDLVIADRGKGAFGAVEALAVLQAERVDLPYIIFSDTIGEAVAVETMKAGASDYIRKERRARLIPAIQRELREAVDRRERKIAEEMNQRLVYHDMLTGLPNRTLMHIRLQQALTEEDRKGRPLAFLLIDLDRFKEINDTLGHRIGDELLQVAGQRVQRAVGKSGEVSRFGGDEFGVLLPSADAEEATRVAGGILGVLERPIVLEGLQLEVGASIGIALYPDHGTDADLLIQRADVAMYVAKGRLHGCVVYTPEKDHYSPQRLAFLGELRRGIDGKHMFLVYQPKLDLRTGRIVGVEALVRWRHPGEGVIPPERFITLAERTGLVKSLTQFVLEEAVAQCVRWEDEGLKLPVAVNLSARSLEDPELPEQIHRVLQRGGLSPAYLELEITESSLMTDPVNAAQLLARLNAMGFKLSIDDFGTGYSSLVHLMKLPVDLIKIDKSFVMDMEVDTDARMIIRSTIELAHALDLGVVAEGVEHATTLDRLKDLRCDIVQGYHICKPAPSDEIARWIRQFHGPAA